MRSLRAQLRVLEPPPARRRRRGVARPPAFCVELVPATNASDTALDDLVEVLADVLAGPA